jgi:ubiquinone/menaquinone biosynthesis C-methylase UbiE
MQPIDVSGLARDARALQEIRRSIRDRLRALHGSFPQIPMDARKLEAVIDRLLDVVLKDVGTPMSPKTLSQRLQDLQIKGMGQANQLWPQLFVMSSSPTAAAHRIDVPRTSRAEVSESVRGVLRNYFSDAPVRLEWVIATVLAWRPASARDLHDLLKKVDPQFPELRSFEEALGNRRVFEADAPDTQSPDWTLLWEYAGRTGYGEGYPADVHNFLQSFFSDLKALDPAATILDIGTGNHGATLLARGVSGDFELLGIDVARLPAPAKEARIRALRMSAEQLGFSDGQFAAVTSVNGIEYADVDRAFPEMHRVMRRGAPGALILHRPDSLIVESARKFLDFVKTFPLMETLALAWMYAQEGSEVIRSELVQLVAALRRIEVSDDFGRYYRAVLNGIPEAVGLRKESPERAREMIERFEKDLRWRHQRDEFMVSHMARIPADREELGRWLRRERFVVDEVSEVFHDDARSRAPLGWAVRFHKPDHD